MKRKWTRTLALSLGLLAGSGARGQEVTWHAQATSPIAITTPAASIGRPVVVASSSQTTSQAGVPAASTPVANGHGSPPSVANGPGSPAGVIASIGRPVPIASAGNPDPQVQPAGFSVPDAAVPLVRAQSPELIPAKPMPAGTGDGAASSPVVNAPGSPGTVPTLHGWRRADDVVAASRPASSSPIIPAQSPVGAPVPVGPGGPAPMFTGLADPCAPMDCGHGTCCGGTCGGGVCCEGGCGGCGGGCCPNHRWYVSAEYLLWWLKGDRTPPLVSAGDPNAAGAMASVIGQPTTRILYGGRDEGTGANSGIRLYAGWWFCDDHLWGIEAGGFALSGDNRFNRFSTGMPALGRPIIDQTPVVPAFNGVGIIPIANPFFGNPAVELVAITPVGGNGGTAGSVSVDRKSTLWGADLNLRRNLLCGPCGYVDLFFGYRMLGLDESLSVNEALVVTGNRFFRDTTGALTTIVSVPAGTMLAVQDRFATTNRFYGGQIGVAAERDWGCWSLQGKLGLGLGSTQQTVEITGVSTSGMGGLLALPGTNIGHYSRNRFSVVPELGLNLGYQFTQHLRGFVGYNFLYWNEVARPGEQIDLNVNRTYQPGSPFPRMGAAVPAFAFHSTDFWAQGVTFGLELRY
jgi:hypothetical protein